MEANNPLLRRRVRYRGKRPFPFALGVEVATIGVVPLSFGTAIIEERLSPGATKMTAIGLGHFL